MLEFGGIGYYEYFVLHYGISVVFKAVLETGGMLKRKVRETKFYALMFYQALMYFGNKMFSHQA